MESCLLDVYIQLCTTGMSLLSHQILLFVHWWNANKQFHSTCMYQNLSLLFFFKTCVLQIVFYSFKEGNKQKSSSHIYWEKGTSNFLLLKCF